MAGHSKWRNIQHRKGAQDAKRGKLFTKLIREITVSAKTGSADPDANPRLRAAIDNAKTSGMSKDTIERAIKRGVGDSKDSELFEIRYEGYGPNGVAVLLDCLTDNKNRTVSDVRHLFTKYGGNLGTDGSVAYLFKKTGLISFPSSADENKIMEIALEAGAYDIINNDDGSIDVLTDPDKMLDVKETLTQSNLIPEGAEITMLASTEITVTDEEQAAKLAKLFDMLEDLDDVQKVYSNADIPEELLEKLES